MAAELAGTRDPEGIDGVALERDPRQHELCPISPPVRAA
jgi:hypothetical protein